MDEAGKLLTGRFDEPLTAEMIAAMPEQIRPFAEPGRLLQLEWSANHKQLHGHDLYNAGYCSLWVVVDELARLTAAGMTPDKLGAFAVAAWLTLGRPAVELQEYYRAEVMGRKLLQSFQTDVRSPPADFKATGGPASPTGTKKGQA